jgi:hypothetical protein
VSIALLPLPAITPSIVVYGLGILAIAALSRYLQNYIWRPVRNFLALRRKTKAHMLQFKDLKWHVASIFGDDGIVGEIAHQDRAAFCEAQTAFSILSDQLIDFGRSKQPATFLIRRMGIDPVLAGRHLANLADELGTSNENRHANYHAVSRALKL